MRQIKIKKEANKPKALKNRQKVSKYYYGKERGVDMIFGPN
jgi:hypothetical protein